MTRSCSLDAGRGDGAARGRSDTDSDRAEGQQQISKSRSNFSKLGSRLSLASLRGLERLQIHSNSYKTKSTKKKHREERESENQEMVIFFASESLARLGMVTLSKPSSRVALISDSLSPGGTAIDLANEP